MARSAIEKLNVEKQPKFVDRLPDGCKWGPPGSTMIVSTPREVDGIMKRIRKGKLTTTAEIRECLAERHGADIACPISTGMFINISAAAASEMLAQGRKRVTPYWRTLKSGGELNPKFPGGLIAHRKLLQKEGFAVEKKGKNKYVVSDFERFVTKPAASD